MSMRRLTLCGNEPIHGLCCSHKSTSKEEDSNGNEHDWLLTKDIHKKTREWYDCSTCEAIC